MFGLNRAKWLKAAIAALAAAAAVITASGTAGGSKTPTSDPAVCFVIRLHP